MKQHPTLEDVVEIARRAHAGQVDKAGKNYLEHPLRVAATLTDDDARIVAISDAALLRP